MRLFGRRRFIGGAAAVVCVGCAADETPELRTPTTGSGTDVADEPALGSLGRSIEVGAIDDVLTDTAEGPLYVPEARAWLIALPADEAAAVAKTADPALGGGLERGLLALSQRCPHLGCRVPYCQSSGWFECACHGAYFTRTGEHRAGPGPRGMDPMPVLVDGGVVSIVAVRIEGPPVGTQIVDQPPSGPHCVDGGSR